MLIVIAAGIAAGQKLARSNRWPAGSERAGLVSGTRKVAVSPVVPLDTDGTSDGEFTEPGVLCGRELLQNLDVPLSTYC